MTALAKDGRKRDLGRVTAVVTAMVNELGGINQVVREVARCLEAAPPGSPAKARVFRALIEALATLDEAERAEAARIHQDALRGIERENERYAWARDWSLEELAEDKANWLRRLGWTVTPPPT